MMKAISAKHAQVHSELPVLQAFIQADIDGGDGKKPGEGEFRMGPRTQARTAEDRKPQRTARQS